MAFDAKFVKKFLIGFFMFGMVVSVGATDIKTLVQNAKSAIRAAENAGDSKTKYAKLDEARDLITWKIENPEISLQHLQQQLRLLHQPMPERFSRCSTTGMRSSSWKKT